MIMEIFEDGMFAAIAAIGFSSISNTPRRAFGLCAIIAATGHAIRFILTSSDFLSMNIIAASFIAAFAIGILAVLCAPMIKCPAEVCFFPSLLPMIPGMYAYRTVEALLACMQVHEETEFMHYLYLFAYNAFVGSSIIIAMVIGATVPIFLLKRISFQATR